MAKTKDCAAQRALHQASFQQRMEAQCCQIERYRARMMYSEGRFLSQNEAAQEWIERYANSFDYNSQACSGEESIAV